MKHKKRTKPAGFSESNGLQTLVDSSIENRHESSTFENTFIQHFIYPLQKSLSQRFISAILQTLVEKVDFVEPLFYIIKIIKHLNHPEIQMLEKVSLRQARLLKGPSEKGLYRGVHIRKEILKAIEKKELLEESNDK